MIRMRWWRGMWDGVELQGVESEASELQAKPCLQQRAYLYRISGSRHCAMYSQNQVFTKPVIAEQCELNVVGRTLAMLSCMDCSLWNPGHVESQLGILQAAATDLIYCLLLLSLHLFQRDGANGSSSTRICQHYRLPLMEGIHCPISIYSITCVFIHRKSFYCLKNLQMVNVMFPVCADNIKWLPALLDIFSDCHYPEEWILRDKDYPWVLLLLTVFFNYSTIPKESSTARIKMECTTLLLKMTLYQSFGVV